MNIHDVCWMDGCQLYCLRLWSLISCDFALKHRFENKSEGMDLTFEHCQFEWIIPLLIGILDCRMWDNCHQLVWQCYQILTMVASVLLQQCVGFINSSRDVTDVTCKFRICVVWVWLPSLNRYIDINTIQILVHLAPLSYEKPLRNRSERSTSAKYETRKYENTRS